MWINYFLLAQAYADQIRPRMMLSHTVYWFVIHTDQTMLFANLASHGRKASEDAPPLVCSWRSTEQKPVSWGGGFMVGLSCKRTYMPSITTTILLGIIIVLGKIGQLHCVCVTSLYVA